MTAQIIEFAPILARVRHARGAARRDARDELVAERIRSTERFLRDDEERLTMVEDRIARGVFIRGPRKGQPYDERNLKDLDRWRRNLLGRLAYLRDELAELREEVGR